MVNTFQLRAEQDFDAYERYLANKRLNVAPMLGTNVCLATVTLGLTEAAEPKSVEYSNSFETYANPLGEVALAPVITLDDYHARHATPRQALASFKSQVA